MLIMKTLEINRSFGFLTFVLSKERHYYKDDPKFKRKIVFGTPTLTFPVFIQGWIKDYYFYLGIYFYKIDKFFEKKKIKKNNQK